MLAAVAPGPLLRCTMLGFADHHALEALLAAVVLWRVAALIRAAERERADGGRFLRVAVEGLGVGIALAAYLLNWIGGVLLVAVLTAWVVVHWTAASVWRRDCLRLAVGVGVMMFPALAAAWWMRDYCIWYQYAAFGLAGLAGLVVILTLGMAFLRRWSLRGRNALLVMATLAIGAGGLVALVRPGWAETTRQLVSWYVFGRQRSLVEEASPLLYREGAATLAGVWETFAAAGLAALAGGGLLAVAVVRRRWSGGLLILVWAAMLAAATVQQQRFGYYAACGAALLAGYAVDRFGQWLERRRWADCRAGRGALVCVAVTLGLVLPAWPLVGAIVTNHTGPAPDWRAALTWLRANTEEPFGDADYYYARYDESGPASRYGVLSAWDRGYWIVALGRRAPCGNPTQAGAAETSRFLVAGTEAEGLAALDALGARYVMLDCTMPVWQDADGRLAVGKFENIARWAGEDPRRYFERCYQRGGDGRWRGMMVYYPDYYRTMTVRLYTFGGQAYAPQGAGVAVALETRADAPGRVVREARRFASAEEAAAFAARHADAGWRAVGLSPFESCVPLAAVTGLKGVYRSPTAVAARDGVDVGYVEVFEWEGGSQK